MTDEAFMDLLTKHGCTATAGLLQLEREREMVAAAFGAAASFDYAKAFKEYADAIGITMDELTTQQKQQAVMDAILKEA